MKKGRIIKKYVMIIALILVVIGAFVALMIFLNNNKNSYTLLEKRWLSDNSSTVVRVKVDNDIPVFSSNGDGVFYDFLSDLEKDAGVSFDIVTSGSGDYEFTATDNRNEDNLLFFTDVYSVVTSKDVEVKSLEDLEELKVGIIKSDEKAVNNYFSNKNDVTITTYDDYTKLKQALSNNIDVMIIPTNRYLEDILVSDLKVIYQLDGLNKYYELNTEVGSEELNSVMKKFLNKWEDVLKTNYNEYLLNLYTTSENISEMDIESITRKDLVVGYINNVPYEGRIQKNFTGITNEYLEGFADFSGVTYRYSDYENASELDSALKNGDVDIVLNYSGLSNSNYEESQNITASDYVVLAHQSNDIVVDNISSLKSTKVTMLKDNALTKYFKEQDSFAIKEEENVKKLLKNLNEDSVILIDKVVYEANKTGKLKDFSIRYMEDNNIGYNFLTKKSRKTLPEMLDFYLTTTSAKQLVEKGTYNTVENIKNNTILGFVLTNIVYVIIIILIILAILWKYRKRVKVQKKIKKEDKMMYIDVMTNLKNRNFLNDNIELWDSNKVYPQTVIVIDLKGIKEINDTNGHEEGDRQIKAAANILIKTQRENSEVMRTDGNEFLIYLVGYNEKVITTYLHKLNKEFKNLPYDYGAKFGYSMINDEIKTLDDAINESLIMMNDND